MTENTTMKINTTLKINNGKLQLGGANISSSTSPSPSNSSITNNITFNNSNLIIPSTTPNTTINLAETIGVLSKLTSIGDGTITGAIEWLKNKIDTILDSVPVMINVYISGYDATSNSEAITFNEPLLVAQIESQLNNVISVNNICESLGGDISRSESAIYTVTEDIVENGLSLTFNDAYLYMYTFNNNTVSVTLRDLTDTIDYRPLTAFDGKTVSYDSCFMNYNGSTTLNLSSWNVANVTSLKSCFSGCSSLVSLNLSGWDISNVTDISNCFNNCSNLTTLNLTDWDVSNIEDFDNCFNGCTSLTTIYCTPSTYGYLHDYLPSGGHGSWNYSTSENGAILA